MRAVGLIFLSLLGAANADSPVQKVIELLQENKVKVQRDLDAESKAMADYSDFCDTTASEKGYAIKTATRKIADLTASIQDGNAQKSQLQDEIAELGTQAAVKEQQLQESTSVRRKENADFVDVEKELSTSVDQLERAVVVIKREMGTSLLQTPKGKKRSPNEDMKMELNVISKVLDAGWVNAGTKKALQGLMQTKVDAGEEDSSDLKFGVPAPTVKAFESSSSGILSQIEEMKEKAEDTLSNARRAEQTEAHNFDMMAQSLTDAMNINSEKTSEAKHQKATVTEENGKAKNELVETSKTKKADARYLATLTQECNEARENWAERQASAASEMGALEKAKEILSSRVNVFTQMGGQTSPLEKDFNGISEASSQASSEDSQRSGVMRHLKDLSKKFPNFALMEMVSSANAGPFDKIRGLIEDMIAKLVTEANEEATQKGFCDEEMSKSRAARDDKSMTIDKLRSRIDKAATGKAELEQAVKELQKEIATLDASTSNALRIRQEEHASYLQGSKDFKEAAEATQAAIGVLKEYYESSFVQTSSKIGAPALGGSKSDAANSIISILEMCEENFTKMYMEIETAEQGDVADFAKLNTENKVSKASKEAEVKGALSEINSLEVSLRNNNEDYEMTSKELDAVNAYLEKLKPQCETKVMSYAEKKARREAEVDGLKEALSLLDEPSLVQTQSRNLRAHQH